MNRKRDEMTGGLRNLHNEELRKFTPHEIKLELSNLGGRDGQDKYHAHGRI